jgi:hypothetical protein
MGILRLYSIQFLLILWLSLLSFLSIGYSQGVWKQIERPRLELIYIGAGDQLIDRAGQVALRVYSEQRDEVYCFDEYTPRYFTLFYQMLLGRAQRWTEVYSFPVKVHQWKRADRSITSYPLRLSPRQSMDLAKRLTSYVGENRFIYIGDPFRETGAIHIRNLFDAFLQGQVSLAGREVGRYRSFRDDIALTYINSPLITLGATLFGGPSLDQEYGLWHLSYRPSTLINLFSRVYTSHNELLGQPKKLHIQKRAIQIGFKSIDTLILLGWSCFWILLILSRRFVAAWVPLSWPALWAIGGLISGLIGGIGWFLSIQSLWVDVRTQSGLWYFMPFDLICILPWLFNQSTLPQWLLQYSFFRLGFIGIISIGLWSMFDISPSFSTLILALNLWVCVFASWIDLSEMQQSS